VGPNDFGRTNTKSMFEDQMKVNDGLDPQQPTFLHAWNQTTTRKLIAKHGKIPEFTRQDEIQRQIMPLKLLG
jgi:hypothetical protein